MATDRDRALMEAHCIPASDEYFAARPALTGGCVHRAIYESAYARAWRDLAALAAPPVEQQAAEPDMHVAMTPIRDAAKRLLGHAALDDKMRNALEWMHAHASAWLEPKQPAPQAGAGEPRGLEPVGAMHQCLATSRFDRCVHCGAIAEQLNKPCKAFINRAAAQAEPTDAEVLAKIRAAITGYHLSLDRREHGGVAASNAFDAIQEAMGMSWFQGAAARAAQAQGGQQCWSCGASVSAAERAAADGNCPRCRAELDDAAQAQGEKGGTHA